jgi:hypothetical protein
MKTANIVHGVETIFEHMRRCTRCILPETFPGIDFDIDGVCNYCHSHEPITVFGEERLRVVLDNYQNRGREFDCVVPISGGRDSAFVLHEMVKTYGMRVLALTVDTGAILPEGYANIEKITKTLQVPHVWLKDEKQIQTAKENMRRKFHGWLKYPSINMVVPVLNSGDKTMNLRMFQYAHQHNIPLVIGGNNIGNSIFEQEHWKTGYMGVFPDTRGYYSGSDKIRLSVLFGMEFLRNPANYSFSVFKEYFTGAGVYFFETRMKPKDVDTLGFYDYVYWNEQKILSTITKECGWRSAEDSTATWRVDDAAYPLINYIYYHLVGFTEHDELYSKMIREGQINRDDALRRCQSDQEPRVQKLQQMFKDLDVTKEQVDDLLENYGRKLLEQFKFSLTGDK